MTKNTCPVIPDQKKLLYYDAILFSVYGWNPQKVSEMKLSTIVHWVNLAKKRMTWKEAYKFNKLLEPEKSLWKKILSKIKS